eukprot:jgi/Chrzof1/13277/Cz07g27080.t1
MQAFEHLLWSWTPSVKLKLSNGLIIPMHKEIIRFVSPVLTAMFARGTADKEHCCVCPVPRDWPQSKPEAKDTWLLWLWYVYLPYMGNSTVEELSMDPTRARDVLVLAEKLGSQAAVIDQITASAWGSGHALIELAHPGDISWAAISWSSKPGEARYSWQVCEGPLGTEYRFFQIGRQSVPHVLRFSPSGAAEFRAAYMKVLEDTLALCPYVPVEEVVHSVLPLLACDVSAGHHELLDQVSAVCSRCPDFLRAFILGSLDSMQACDTADIPLSDFIITKVSCADRRSNLKVIQGDVTTEAAPSSSSTRNYAAGDRSPPSDHKEESSMLNGS